MKELKVGECFNYCGKKFTVIEDNTGNCHNCAFCCGEWCANSTLKCKNHAWNVLNSRLIYDWIQRERSDNKCVIFKEVEENERA